MPGDEIYADLTANRATYFEIYIDSFQPTQPVIPREDAAAALANVSARLRKLR